MAKVVRFLCDRCESRVVAGEPFCGSCGYPTTWASHDERTAWEVAQYREKTVNAPMAPAAHAPIKRASARTDILERAKPVVAAREKKSFGLFGRRRAPSPAVVLPEPKRVEPPVEIESAPAAVLTMVRPEAAPEAPAPVARSSAVPKTEPVAPKVERVVPKPAPRPRAATVKAAPPPKAAGPKPAMPKADGLVSRVERAMDDNEALLDTPATVLAMRMLNQRVRELDEKVQRLERELAAAKAQPAAAPEEPRKRFGR